MTTTTRKGLVLSLDDVRRVHALRDLAPNVLSEHRVMRLAMRMGLGLLELDPSRLLGAAKEPPKGEPEAA